jgi:acetyl-CoA C-acetyltransferase
MMKRVAIIGYGLIKYSYEISTSSEEMGFRVAKMAQEASGISRDDIDSIHNSTMDLFDGVTISNGILAPAAGGYNRDSVRIQNGGVFAIISACANILSDSAQIAVVNSADAVQYDITKVSNMSTDPFFHQQLGLNNLITYAYFSSQYLEKNEVSEEDFALVAAQNYHAGAQNPYALINTGHSFDDVMTSPYLAWPLRAYEVAPNISYGSAALILASEKMAKEFSNSPVWITGFGMATNSVNLGDSISMLAFKKAATDAYKMAGIHDPLNDIDVAEINNPFSPWELAAYEALGLCQELKPADLVREGITSREGKLPFNPSGGTLCTNAPNSNGLFRAIQAVIYLNNLKKSNSKRAIVHDSDMSIGLIGDSHALLVLEKEGD